MQVFGYIENGILFTKEIEPIITKRKIADDIIETITISEEEQIANLPSEWKKVDDIDTSKIKTDDGYIIRVTPFDNGDSISYKYEKVIDTQKKKKEIATLKQQLSDTDYQVTKCYEATLIGETLPYDIVTLHKERQSIREKINELEADLLEILNTSA